MPANNFYDFLSAIHQRPVMYFGRKSLTDLHNFLYGFQMALNLSEAELDTGKFFPGDLRVFAEKFFNEPIPAAFGIDWYILRRCNHDEEKAFDLFFVLLEEFKLEKENFDAD